MQVQAYTLNESAIPTRSLWLSVLFSMICHLAFFMALIFLPHYQPDRSFTTPVIDVSLVNMPPPSPEVPQASAEKESTKVEAAPKTIKESLDGQKKSSPEAVSINPKKYKNKTSLKKKTFKSSKVLKHAISEIEQKVEQTRAKPILSAIEELRTSVEKKEGTDAVGESISTGKRAIELMDIYKAEIPYHIQKNWVFSEQLAGNRTDLVAWLVIEIRPDGRISDIWFEKRSGNRYFDDQAYKAVKKSDPLPPLPKDFLRPFFNVGLRFTPSGLK
jgi:colicin import membrane protein